MHFYNVRMVKRLKKFEFIVSHLSDFIISASNNFDCQILNFLRHDLVLEILIWITINRHAFGVAWITGIAVGYTIIAAAAWNLFLESSFLGRCEMLFDNVVFTADNPSLHHASLYLAASSFSEDRIVVDLIFLFKCQKLFLLEDRLLRLCSWISHFL